MQSFLILQDVHLIFILHPFSQDLCTDAQILLEMGSNKSDQDSQRLVLATLTHGGRNWIKKMEIRCIFRIGFMVPRLLFADMVLQSKEWSSAML